MKAKIINFFSPYLTEEYPIWWDEAPAMIATFLESNDFSGKTIVPFCTSASDTIENSLHIFGELCPDAVIADGLTANDTEEIGPWLQQLGYEVSASFEGTPITITAGGQVFEAVLDGSETAAAFAEMLPMTLSMQRVGGGREFYVVWTARFLMTARMHRQLLKTVILRSGCAGMVCACCIIIRWRIPKFQQESLFLEKSLRICQAF